jgi:hypothetical protein
MILRWIRGPGTIFGHTLMLVVGIIMVLGAINAALIFFRPPPRVAPLSAYEVARLLRERPIAKNSPNLVITRSVRPAPAGEEAGDPLLRVALARNLGQSTAAVFLDRPDAPATFHPGANSARIRTL